MIITNLSNQIIIPFRHNNNVACNDPLPTLARDLSSCINGQIRLWSAYNTTRSNEGVLQICKGGQWYSSCRYGNCYTAKTACKQLGYEGLACK